MRVTLARVMAAVVVTSLVGAACSGGSGSGPKPGAQATGCPVVFIGARGSGEDPQPIYSQGDFGMGELNLVVFSALRQSVNDLAPAPQGVQYPAIALAQGWDIPVFVGNAGGAFFNVDAGQFGRYRQSVQAGISWLTAYLEAPPSQPGCGQSRFVLSGYSQGAQVVADTVTALPSNYQSRIAAVVLFGDPQFNGHSAADRSTYIRGRDGVLSGISGARPEYPSWLAGKVLSFCHADDPVCQAYEIVKGKGRLAPTAGMARDAVARDPLRDHKNYAASGSADLAHAVSDLLPLIR